MRLFEALFLLPLLLAPSTHAGDSLELSQTRSPIVNLTPDGKARVERRFDAKGQLTEVSYYDYSIDPPQVERLHIVRGDPKVYELRTRTTERGKILLRREIERYLKPRILDTREIEWSSRDDGVLDQRTVLHYANLHVQISEYQRSGADWKLMASREQAELENGRDDDYVSCLARSGRADDPAQCKSVLDAIPIAPHQLSELQVAKYTSLECSDNDVLFLPNGFSVDLASCVTPDRPQLAVDAIRAATNTIMGEMVSCIGNFNPRLARKIMLDVDARRPLIHCAGDRARLPSTSVCDKDQPDFDACVKDFDGRRDSTEATFKRSRPNDLFLTGVDPLIEPRVAAVAPDGSNRGLGAVALHESMHGLGYSGDALNNPKHSARPPNRGDVVYGCQALCGGSEFRKYLTREGCRDCALAESNTPPGAFLDNCEKYPVAEDLRRVNEAAQISADFAACDVELAKPGAPADGGDGCNSARALDADQDQCKGLGYADCRRTLKTYAAHTVLEFVGDVRHRKAIAHFAATDSTRVGYDRMTAVVSDGYCEELEKTREPTEDDVAALRATYNVPGFASIIPPIPANLTEAQHFCQRWHQREADRARRLKI